jgi:PAS domain S-box-containing protein
MIHVLYIDDDKLHLELIKEYLEKQNDISVDITESINNAFKKIQLNDYTAIICDYHLPQSNGIQFLKTLRQCGDNTPFIFFTGKGEKEIVIEAINNGADYYVEKGNDPKINVTQLRHWIIKASEKSQIENDVRFLNVVTQCVSDGIIITTLNYEIIFINDAAEKIFGYMRNNLITEDVHTILPKKVNLNCNEKTAPNENQKYEHNYFARKKSGETFMCNVTTSPLYENGDLVGIVKICKPIKCNHNKTTNNSETLEEYKDALQNEIMTNETKNKTIGKTIRHNIMNNVSTIHGFADIIHENEKLTEKEAHQVQNIITAANKIKKEIEFITNYQQIGANDRKWINIGYIIKNNQQKYQNTIDIQNLIGDTSIHADPMFDLVINELICNTIKHSENAKTIKIYIEHHADNVHLIIEDDGKGIAIDEKEYIFNHGYGFGNGLNLYLIKEIVTESNMDIIENGTKNKGAKFSIIIPKNQVKQTE